MSDPKISEAQQNKNTFRISDKDLIENNLVKKYLGRINGLDATVSNIAINLVPRGLTEAQYFNIIMQLDRNNEERFSKALEEIFAIPSLFTIERSCSLANKSTAKQPSKSVAVVITGVAPIPSAITIASSLAPPKCPDKNL